MKYIIEFENEPKLKEEGLSYYTCVDAPWWSASDHLIGKLTPYTEGKDYKQGTSDAWEFARHLNALTHDITDIIYMSMNGGKGMDVAFKMTYEEAKKEYDEYCQKKKEKEREKNFCVGAEVKNEDGETAYVLNPDYGGCLVLSMKKYVCPQIQGKSKWKCTGIVSESVKRMLEYE